MNKLADATPHGVRSLAAPSFLSFGVASLFGDEMMAALRVVEAVWITELVWMGWRFRGFLFER
jgi:hypothetical protein